MRGVQEFTGGQGTGALWGQNSGQDPRCPLRRIQPQHTSSWRNPSKLCPQRPAAAATLGARADNEAGGRAPAPRQAEEGGQGGEGLPPGPESWSLHTS